jgi:hypothetical protein
MEGYMLDHLLEAGLGWLHAYFGWGDWRLEQRQAFHVYYLPVYKYITKYQLESIQGMCVDNLPIE